MYIALREENKCLIACKLKLVFLYLWFLGMGGHGICLAYAPAIDFGANQMFFRFFVILQLNSKRGKQKNRVRKDEYFLPNTMTKKQKRQRYLVLFEAHQIVAYLKLNAKT